MLELPGEVMDLLRPLRAAGYQAYVVGGCVRDWLRHVTPKDWDICTDAQPDEMKRVFHAFRQVDTGLKHGTLTVIHHGAAYEVTTFRVDGDYGDHRHPNTVSFVRDVREDLARRDFTINAMAYHPDTGIIDAFGGQADLQSGIIRAVGNPEKRFEEDALRILRGLRFASRLGFRLEEQTAQAMMHHREDLSRVAAERIRAELCGILIGQGVAEILRACWPVLGVVLPEIVAAVGFDQRTVHHRYDVWEHTVRAVAAVPPVLPLRLTMLFHDLGKPGVFFLDEAGIGHACGHSKRSADMAEEAMRRLRFDNATRERVVQLVAAHDWPLTAEEKLLRRRLQQLGEEALRQLLAVQLADGLAKGTKAPETVEARIHDIRQSLDVLLARQPCYSLKTLAISGGDLLALGMKPGKQMGALLSQLLEEVVEGNLSNDRAALLAEVHRRRQ